MHSSCNDGGTWLSRGSYGVYVAITGSMLAVTGSTWRLYSAAALPSSKRQEIPVLATVVHASILSKQKRVNMFGLFKEWGQILEKSAKLAKSQYQTGVNICVYSLVVLEWPQGSLGMRVHSKTPAGQREPESYRVHWGQTPFRVKADPEIGQLSADLTK